jgi:hypothetical protein
VLHFWPDAVAELDCAQPVVNQEGQKPILGRLVAVVMSLDYFIAPTGRIFDQRNQSVSYSNRTPFYQVLIVY